MTISRVLRVLEEVSRVLEQASGNLKGVQMFFKTTTSGSFKRDRGPRLSVWTLMRFWFWPVPVNMEKI